MSLDLTNTAKQLDDMSKVAKSEVSDRLDIIHEILAFIRGWDHDSYLQGIHDSSDNVQSFGAEINEAPASLYPPLPLPT